MTDNTQPEALMQLADAYAEASFDQGLHKRTLDDAPESARSVLEAAVRSQHARIAELEAQLASIGAGGVTGPLIGQPQAMPDLSQLTERGAVAWTGVDAQGLREGRWYMVTHDGVATLCEDRRDAEKEAKDADMAWPHSGPHRAVQLVESSMAGFTAADMATAESRGFRDGVASVAANAASEPVAWRYRSGSNGNWEACTKEVHDMVLRAPQRWAGYEVQPLYTHPSPPEGMAGWMPIAEAPKTGRTLLLGYFNSTGKWRTTRGEWLSQDHIDEYAEDPDCMSPGWHETTVEDDDGKCWPIDPTHWMPLPPAPTSAEGVEHADQA